MIQTLLPVLRIFNSRLSQLSRGYPDLRSILMGALSSFFLGVVQRYRSFLPKIHDFDRIVLEHWHHVAFDFQLCVGSGDLADCLSIIAL